ncbi:MAG: glycosyltransferase family 2 protein [Patescibacteria group bacterium]
MLISAVVLNWNGQEYIEDCLTSLSLLQTGDHQLKVIVVDNGSTDASVDLIKKKFPDSTLIETRENLGYAEGNNVGIRLALENQSDYIWIINPDIKLAPDALISLIHASAKNPQYGIFGSKIYFFPGFEFHKKDYAKKDLGKVIWYAGGLMDWKNLIANHRGVDQIDTGQYDDQKETDFVTGASMFIKSQVIRDVGLLDAKYFLYFEENDFCQGARKIGWRLLYVPESVAWHKNAQATGVGSPLQDYYIARNRMLFGLRHAPIHTKLALVKESLSLLSGGRPWQKQGIKDFYLGRFGKGSYA